MTVNRVIQSRRVVTCRRYPGLLSKPGQWRRWVRARLLFCALTTKYLKIQPCRERMITEANREIGRGPSEANCYTQRRDKPERIACNFTANPDSTIEILPALGILCGYRVRVITPGLDTFEHMIGGGQIIGRICYRPDWGVRSSKALSWGMTDDLSPFAVCKSLPIASLARGDCAYSLEAISNRVPQALIDDA